LLSCEGHGWRNLCSLLDGGARSFLHFPAHLAAGGGSDSREEADELLKLGGHILNCHKRAANADNARY